MGIETVSLIIAAFVNGSLGIAAMMRNFRSRLCAAFAAVALLLFAHDALSVLDRFDSGRGFSSPRLHIAILLVLGPTVLVLLKEVAPRAAARARRKRGLGLYFALVLLCLPAVWRLPSRFIPLALIASHLAFSLPAVLWLAGLGHAAKATSLTRERLRLRYAFWGGLFTVAFFLTNALLFAGWHVPPLGTLARVLYLMFLYQNFIQKELITSEELLAKLSLFGGVSLMLSIIFSVLVSWVGDEKGLFFFNTFIASFVIIVLFEPIRKLTSRFTRKLLLPRNSMIENELGAVAGELMGMLEPTELASRLSLALKKCLGAEASQLFLIERDELSFSRVGRNGEIDSTRHFSSSSPLVEYMTLRGGRSFVPETLESDRDSFHSATARRFCQTCLETMREVGADLVIPFLHESRLLGFCAVTTGERIALSNEQLRLFSPLSRQIASLIKSSQLLSRLRDRDRLSMLGEMAAGLAHEIRNPLGAIKGAAEILKEDATTTPQAKPRASPRDAEECLKIILDETGRLTEVLSDFLDYARPRQTCLQTECDPLRVIEHVSELILRDSRVQVEIESAPAGIRLDADPEILKQILLNLFLNAVQAMDGQEVPPSLKVRLREVRPPKPLSFLDSLPRYKIWEGWVTRDGNIEGSGPQVEIQVLDNGPGITIELLPQIFMPFFTTKPKGTGLGLSICQRLVEGMGGTIQAAANQPRGAIFTLHLPIRSKAEVGRLENPIPAMEARPYARDC